MVSLVFIGSFIHHRPGKFSLRPEKFPKRLSFGGGRVHFFFLLCELRESLDSRESLEGCRTEQAFVQIAFRGTNRLPLCSFEAIRANRSNVIKIGFLLRIDSREAIRANRPDSRCEASGHLSLDRL